MLARAVFWSILKGLLPLAILGGSYLLLREQLHALDIDAVHHALDIIPASRLGVALAATIGSYASLGVLEWSLFKAAEVRLPYRSVLLSSFVSNSVSGCIGLTLFTGAFLRLRMYNRLSVAARDTLYVAFALAPMVVISGALVSGVAILFALNSAQLAYSVGQFGSIGVISLVCFALALAMPAAVFIMMVPGKELSFKNLRIVIPTRRRRCVLIAAGVCDWLMGSCALLFLTGLAASTYPLLLVQFVVGWLVGVGAGVPAGAGPLDTTVLRIFADHANLAGLVAGLLMFRVIYFALPALFALTLLVMSELRARVS